MANTRCQHEVESWVREQWAPVHLGEQLRSKRVRLRPGGEFAFDGVSESGETLVCISTSVCRTAGGKHAVGKVMKIRSDLYFLLLAPAHRRICVFTDHGMHSWWLREQQNGRVPAEIEFLHADGAPGELLARLAAAQIEASSEVRPRPIERPFTA